MEKLYKSRITRNIKMKTKKRMSILMAITVALIASIILNKLTGNALKSDKEGHSGDFTLLDGNINNGAIELSKRILA